MLRGHWTAHRQAEVERAVERLKKLPERDLGSKTGQVTPGALPGGLPRYNCFPSPAREGKSDAGVTPEALPGGCPKMLRIRDMGSIWGRSPSASVPCRPVVPGACRATSP